MKALNFLKFWKPKRKVTPLEASNPSILFHEISFRRQEETPKQERVSKHVNILNRCHAASLSSSSPASETRPRSRSESLKPSILLHESSLRRREESAKPQQVSGGVDPPSLEQLLAIRGDPEVAVSLRSRRSSSARSASCDAKQQRVSEAVDPPPLEQRLATRGDREVAASLRSRRSSSVRSVSSDERRSRSSSESPKPSILLREGSFRRREETTKQERVSKDVIRRYSRLVKPLYVKVSKCCHGSSVSELFADSPLSSVATKRRNFRVGFQHLGKSKSTSSSATASSSDRRDDSQLHREDDIKGAILHCKRTFNSSSLED